MDNTHLFAAKTNSTGLWECIPQHLIDTTYVMKYLSDPLAGWVTPSFIEATGICESVFEKVCVFLAATHDIAKFTPAFQKKISYNLPGLNDRLLSHGFDINHEFVSNHFYHAFVSGAILHEYYNVEESICEVVAAHHGIPRDNGREFKWSYPFRHYKGTILGKQDEFKELWDETIKRAEQVSSIKCTELPPLSYSAQILLSGLLITADWIASNEVFFPLFPPWETNTVTDEKRGMSGYKASGAWRGWFPQTFMFSDSIFFDRFGFRPNNLQEIAGNAASTGAKLLIIEGPMGGGKTEAALMCSEIMAAQNACGGFYIGLPTQATSNGLFSRVISWASKASENLAVSINLAHGGALYNNEFKALQVNASDEEPNLSVNKWMSRRHQKLMSDFVDGTIDQALVMSLNRKFFMLLHGQMAGKVVVMDEVHSYDAYTNAYLETTLAYLGYYHCPVVLLSATLTNEKKLDFIKAYSQQAEGIFNKTNGYPCATWWDGNTLHEDIIPDSDIRKINISVQWVQCYDLAEKIKSLLNHGGCAGIIRNTVKEAIKTYLLLKRVLIDYRVVLIHSRFLMDDRSELERRIIKLTGKKSTANDRNKLVVIGTQVLEQSLDIDFDVLFTDPCPMDLLFQRLGRQHRHVRNRPRSLVDAKAFLIIDGDKIVGSNDRPYNRYIVERTCNLVTSSGGCLSLPLDIKPMVEKTYDLSLTETSQEKEEYINQIQRLKNGSRQMRIPDPWNQKSIRGMAQKQLFDESDDENVGVRQGDDSVPVIMLKMKNGTVMDIGETVSCKMGNLPDNHIGDVFLRQIIRIPNYMISQDELYRMKSYAGFCNESIWKYKDILLLDENCCYEHKSNGQKKRFHYSPETGLEEEENE